MPAAGAELADLAGAAHRGGPRRLPGRGGGEVRRRGGGRRRARRDRHGQMRCPRTELHFRRRRHLRDRIRRARRYRAPTPSAPPSPPGSRGRSCPRAANPGCGKSTPTCGPEGKSGPLVRTLASHESYYARWAESWEFQALLKARTIAGDTELGARYEAAVAPLIWSSAGREGFVESVRSMRRRVTEHIPADEEQRQIKLGRGGLRDVEFTVQLLQLVHGKSDETLRCRDTTSAIAALSAGGYIGRSDAAEFDRDYRYLRLLEHRIQLFQLRRTHLMPVKEASLRSLAKAVLGPFSAERPKPGRPGRRLAKNQALRPRTARTHLLPPAAEYRRHAEQRRGTPDPGSRPGPPRRPGLPRSARRHAAHRGPHRRREPARRTPAPAPAHPAGLARRRRGPRRRAARLPARQRGPRHNPLVPGHAPGFDGRGRAALPRARQLPADRGPAGGFARISGVAGHGQGTGAAELRIPMA